MTDVAIATGAVAEDPDLPRLVAALADEGLRAETAAWSDPTVRWDRFAVTVIRSTWDYPMAHRAFLQWLARVPRLWNPPAVVAWNTDKRYLDDLAAHGVPTIPTRYARRGADCEFPEGDVVVKPTVAGGSRGASRFGADERDAARAHVDELARLGLESMVQPHVASVEADGEVDVVVLDGEVSHAVRKRAPLGRPATADPVGPLAVERVEPTPEQRRVVSATLGAVPFPETLCYARVDVVELADGPAVIELEAVEPFLFLEHDEAAAARLARAVARRVREGGAEVDGLP